jgi:hypothetical protein
MSDNTDNTRNINLIVFIVISLALIFGFGRNTPGPDDTVIPG